MSWTKRFLPRRPRGVCGPAIAGDLGDCERMRFFSASSDAGEISLSSSSAAKANARLKYQRRNAPHHAHTGGDVLVSITTHRREEVFGKERPVRLHEALSSSNLSVSTRFGHRSSYSRLASGSRFCARGRQKQISDPRGGWVRGQKRTRARFFL
jgi:hypothetical protein